MEIYVRRVAALKEKPDQDNSLETKISFQQFNAQPHIANPLSEDMWLGSYSSSTLPTDLALSDYHLVRSLKNQLYENSFPNREQAVEAPSEFFQSIGLILNPWDHGSTQKMTQVAQQQLRWPPPQNSCTEAVFNTTASHPL